VSSGILVLLAALLSAQGTPPPSPLTLVSREGRRPVQTTLIGGQEFIGLDDVANLFQVAVKEDTLARGLTVTYRGRTVVLSADQPMASVTGRVVALPAPPLRAGARWLVPVDFLPRALGPIYDARIEYRRAARLLIVGDVPVDAPPAAAAPAQPSAPPAPSATSPSAPSAPVAPPASSAAETAPPPAVLTPSGPVLQTMVIDAGHGGDDIGARGRGGAEEKQITLQVARRLRSLIEARLGIRVILTRDDDTRMSLDDRAAVANNSKADLFLSLHTNASPVPAVSGTEVFHLRLDREGEQALRTAATGAVALPVLGGATRSIDIIRWDLAQARHVEASAAFGAMLEEELRAQVKMSARPRHAAPLRVLTSVNMPAALIEIGYLTNAEEERQVRSDDYQTALAQGIYNAIVRFRGYLEQHRRP
jgi:N-acetylmuramoyl-L-alanine amidase